MSNIEKRKNGDITVTGNETVFDKSFSVDGDLLVDNDLVIDGGDILVSGDAYINGTLTLKKGSLLIGGYLFNPKRIINYGCKIKELYEFDEEQKKKINPKSFVKRLLKK